VTLLLAYICKEVSFASLYGMTDMQRLSDSHQNLGADTSSVEAVSPTSPGSPESPSEVRGSWTQSYESDFSSSDSDEIEPQSGHDYAGHKCFYIEHLRTRHLNISQERDHFLLEHLTAGHLDSCSPLPGSSADEVVQIAPIRQEIPFDQVHCLQPVNLRDELLSPRHIRLLKLYPSTSTNLPGQFMPLRCEPYQVCLHDLTTSGQPLFAAASYVCGDQTPTHRILCGADTVDIPQNAYDVLSHLRFEKRPRLIWIDYLCIKQDDAHEKSHQVSILHTIYAQAHVVSWLRTDRDIDLQGVSSFASLLARLWIEGVRKAERRIWSAVIGVRARGRLESYLESQVELQLYPLRALVSAFTTSYFTRIWIIQEIILGKTKVCQIGNELYSVAVLAAAAYVLGFLRSKDPEQATATNLERVSIDDEVIDHVLDQYLEPALHSRWLSGILPW
jgi:hypothetical protein